MKAFLVSVRGVISPEVHTIPGDEGEFHYSYRTARAGIYFVSVLYDGESPHEFPIQLSSFTIFYLFLGTLPCLKHTR
jgi:hypothetical protein